MIVLKAVGGFFRFWYEFIVGDDWTVAVAVFAALLVSAFLEQIRVVAWWVVPLTVIVVVGISLRRASASRA
jgi:hypothetical protein